MMIKISPSILTSDSTSFKSQLENYMKLFEQIDIDINVGRDSFEGKETLSTKDIVNLINKDYKGTYGIQLMIESPLEHLKLLKELKLKKVKYYLHQEVLPKGYINEDKEICITVKAETALKGVEFYNMFEEVQLMTIKTGWQGNEFIPSVLDKVDELRLMGYKGMISLDGSVNLKTAEIIKQYDINRVSVGSFFSKSNDVELDKMKLTLALNMGRDNF